MTSDLRDSKPYALDVKNSRFGSEGMTFPKAITEKIDDSLDALGNPRLKVIHKEEKDTLCLWNLGENCNQLQKLFGLASEITRKAADKIGLMNKGSFASFCYLEPDNITLISRNLEGKMIELTFPFGKYLQALDKCHENYCDPSVNPTRYIETSKITNETTITLNSLVKDFKDSLLKKEIESMVSASAPHFFGAFLDFNPSHRLYGNLDEELKKCPSLSNLYYSKFLKSHPTTSIIFEDSKGIKQVLDSKSAIDLFHGSSCVKANIEVRTIMKQETIMKDRTVVTKDFYEDVFQVTLSIDGCNETDTFYLTNRPRDGKYHDSQPLYTMPNDWNQMKKLGDFKVRFACLSIQEDLAQRKQIGGDWYDNAVFSRGVMVSWNDRYLGDPWWAESPTTRKTLWGDRRNTGPLRIEIDIKNNHDIIGMVNIQTDKSAINLSNAHPCILRLLDGFMTLAKTFSSTKKTEAQKANKNWKPTWTVDKVYPLISGKEKPAVSKPTPQPPVQPTPQPQPLVQPTPQPQPQPTLVQPTPQPQPQHPVQPTPQPQPQVEPLPVVVFTYRKGQVKGQELLDELEDLSENVDPDKTYTDTEAIEFFNRLCKFKQYLA